MFGRATSDNIIRQMCIACWILKATNRHSECVILIAFEQQNWLQKRFSVLLYASMYTVCLVLRDAVSILTYCSGVLILTQYYRIFLRTFIIALVAMIIPPLQIWNVPYRYHRSQLKPMSSLNGLNRNPLQPVYLGLISLLLYHLLLYFTSSFFIHVLLTSFLLRLPFLLFLLSI